MCIRRAFYVLYFQGGLWKRGCTMPKNKKISKPHTNENNKFSFKWLNLYSVSLIYEVGAIGMHLE